MISPLKILLRDGMIRRRLGAVEPRSDETGVGAFASTYAPSLVVIPWPEVPPRSSGRRVARHTRYPFPQLLLIAVALAGCCRTARADLPPALDTADAEAVIHGEAVSDYFGRQIYGGGDVDGDGRQDLLVGAYGNDEGGSAAGKAYLILGGASLPVGIIPVTTAADASWIGEGAGDYGSLELAMCPDIDGDGAVDLDDIDCSPQDDDDSDCEEPEDDDTGDDDSDDDGDEAVASGGDGCRCWVVGIGEPTCRAPSIPGLLLVLVVARRRRSRS